jgi:hypothetical protein
MGHTLRAGLSMADIIREAETATRAVVADWAA